MGFVKANWKALCIVAAAGVVMGLLIYWRVKKNSSSDEQIADGNKELRAAA